MSVIRRSGRPRPSSPSFSRRNERHTWGGPPPRMVDWGFLAFAFGWTAAMGLLCVIAGRGGL